MCRGRLWLLLWGLALAPLARGQLAADDRVLFVRDGALWVVGVEGGAPRQLSRPGRVVVNPAPCPDGEAVAYEEYQPESGRYDIVLVNLDGGPARTIIENAQNASWAPDGGRLLVALRRRSGSLDIYLLTRAGETIHRLTRTDEHEYYPVFAPDCARVAFVREAIVEGGTQRRQTLVVRDSNGAETDLVSLVGRRFTSLAWSPGRRLVYSATSDRLGLFEQLYTVSPEEPTPRELTDGRDAAVLPRWAPDGESLVYVERREVAGLPRTRPLLRAASGQVTPLPGTREDDSEPSILPGLAHRAPHLYILGRRSFYLPAPRLSGEEILVPARPLAEQLGLRFGHAEGTWELAAPHRSLFWRPDEDRVTVATGEQRREELLVCAPTIVGDALLVPLRATAELLGLICDWSPERRLYRVGGRKPEGATDDQG